MKEILYKLSDERIFSIEKKEDRFIFTEECDSYFSVELSKDDMLKLIEELKDLIK